MWAKIMKERFNAKDPRSLMLRFHTQTAGCTLTAQQPDNNIMRVTIQALSAVLGGTQSLHTNSRDEALALPTEESVRIALRIQQVLACESGVADSIDPLAGSFLVESLTDQIEKAAFEYIDKIDKLGGAVEAISRGFQQKEIQDSAYAYQRAIETNEMVIVGVNKFMVEEPPPSGLLRVKEEVERSQKKSIADMKAKRDGATVRNALESLEIAARGTDNLMPHILAAVKCYATLGEIADVFREVFGKHRETVVL
jgi:methylmalonyl-CoA mutase N-terminal domain/subunit